MLFLLRCDYDNIVPLLEINQNKKINSKTQLKHLVLLNGAHQQFSCGSKVILPGVLCVVHSGSLESVTGKSKNMIQSAPQFQSIGTVVR